MKRAVILLSVLNLASIFSGEAQTVGCQEKSQKAKWLTNVRLLMFWEMNLL